MEPLVTRISRISEMERIFDILLSHDAVAIRRDPILARMLRQLMAYYESSQWLEDYRFDEQGGLPSDLKRGVLSQDGIYNLLLDLENAEAPLDNSEPTC